MQAELFTVDRRGEVAKQRGGRIERPGVGAGIGHPHPPPSGALGLVHRVVGLRHKILGRHDVVGPLQSDARTHGHERGGRREANVVEGALQAGGSVLRGLPRLDVVEDDHELVATEATDRILRARGRQEGFGHGDERVVADAVAVGVVEHLEVVEIDDGHRHSAGAAALEPRQHVGEAVEDRDAVGDTGERVGEREAGEVFGGLHRCGHVRTHEEVARRRAVGPGDRDDANAVPTRRVDAWLDPYLFKLHRLVAAQRLEEALAGSLARYCGSDEVLHPQRAHRLGAHPHRPPRCRVDGHDAAIELDAHHRIGRRFEQRRELPLGLGDLGHEAVGGLAPTDVELDHQPSHVEEAFGGGCQPAQDVELAIVERAGLAVDHAQRAEPAALPVAYREARVEADVRRADDERVVRESGVSEGVGDDQRFVGSHDGVGAERRFSCGLGDVEPDA